MFWKVLALSTLVLLAGCGGFLVTDEPAATEPPSTESTATQTQTPVATVEPTPEPTPMPTPTSTPTPTPSYANPWNSAEVTVTINGSGDNRNYQPVIVEGIEYWNENMDLHTPYDFEFVLTADDDADVVIDLTSERIICGYKIHLNSTTLGCATELSEGTQPDYTETVEISTSQSDSSLKMTTRHEIGHLLGLSHYEEPHNVMGNSTQENPVQNASDRIHPYSRNKVTVTVVNESFNDDADLEKIHQEARYATQFFRQGASGTVPKIEFEYAPNATGTESEFAVYGNRVERDCTPGGDGSLGTAYGVDRDTDQRLEYYTDTNICLRGLDEDALSWHIGRWMGVGMGLSEGEMPSQIVSADYDERRGSWHGA